MELNGAVLAAWFPVPIVLGKRAEVIHSFVGESIKIMPTSETVREALQDVKDPELNIPILDLGLVYDISVEGESNEHVNVVMTLTSPMCPVGPMFKKAVEDKVRGVEGVQSANVDITFTPPWDPRTMASDDVKMMLGIW